MGPKRTKRIKYKGDKLLKVKLENEAEAIKNIVKLQIVELYRMSKEGLLSKDDSAKLMNYFKIIMDFKKAETDELENMGPEELKKIVEGK